MTDDIEDLKVHHIPPPRADKVFLPQVGQGRAPAEPVEHVELDGKPAAGVVDVAALRDRVEAALRTVYDPEIPVNIYDLGLIYKIEVSPEAVVRVDMTLTAPACPVAGQLVQEVAEKVARTEGVARSSVDLVWEPAWTRDRMTDAAKLELGLL